MRFKPTVLSPAFSPSEGPTLPLRQGAISGHGLQLRGNIGEGQLFVIDLWKRKKSHLRI